MGLGVATRGALPRLRGRCGRNPGGKPLWHACNKPASLCLSFVRPKRVATGGSRERPSAIFCTAVLLVSSVRHLQSNQTLGNSREPPCFHVFRPNSRHHKKPRNDQTSVEATPLQGADRIGLASEATLHENKKKGRLRGPSCKNQNKRRTVPPGSYPYTGASVRPPNPSGRGNRDSSGRLSTGLDGIGGGGFSNLPLLMISRT